MNVPKKLCGGKWKEALKTLTTGEDTLGIEKSLGLIIRDIQMSWMTENFNYIY